ncbi:MAG: MauE/DoxX family redox-associated membrane protein [Bacteroidota bacterium]
MGKSQNIVRILLRAIGELSPVQRTELSARLICAALIAGKLMSWKLWLNSRSYPLSPVWPGSAAIPYPADYTIACATLLSIGLFGLFPRKTLFLWLYLGLELLNLLQDQNRWQSWLYEYLLLLLPLLWLKPNIPDSQALRILRLQAFVLAATYLFSGIQKINPVFLPVVWQNILHRLFFVKTADMASWLPYGYAIPAIEIAGALLLAFKNTRTAGLVIMLLMHLFILFYLMPSGINYNSIVWPWNFALILINVIVLYKSRFSFWHNYRKGSADSLFPLYTVLLLLLPVLSLYNLYDLELSASLFTGKFRNLVVFIKPEALPKIPPKLKQHVCSYKYLVDNYRYEPGPDARVISMQVWAMDEMNVSPLSETRIYQGVVNEYCRLGLKPDEITFMLYASGKQAQRVESMHCTE